MSELQAIGVALNASAGCALMAQHLQGLSNVDKISSIYSYLEACRWKPRYTSDDWIWIPHEADEGAWVNPASCVLYDRNNLFGSQLHVLVKWYNSKLLRYFNTIFGVKHHPTVSDYCKLWSVCRTPTLHWHKKIVLLSGNSLARTGAPIWGSLSLVVSRRFQFVLEIRSCYLRDKMSSFLMIYYWRICSRSRLSNLYSFGILQLVCQACLLQN